ncbi:MAG: hypothetical protein MJ252_11090 [archaeon]|nr:hypothetical protein [archaeon]
MKWISIKLTSLPLIFQEIDMVTETYVGLLQKIMQDEKGKEKDSKDKSKKSKDEPKEESEDKKEFNQLREDVYFLLN